MTTEEVSSVSNESDDTHAPPRTLAGATILQIVPALREEPSARAALLSKFGRTSRVMSPELWRLSWAVRA